MYDVNKLIWIISNPAAITVVLLFLLTIFRRRWVVVLVAIWCWLWTSPVLTKIIGYSLESPYDFAVTKSVEEYPVADAIVDLGGGVGFSKGNFAYPQLNDSGDRAWHSARLWKAKRAPVVIPSGLGIGDCDRQLLLDLGVPDDAIIIEGEARNTEENARMVASLLSGRAKSANDLEKKPKILLVTSAWHMRRSVLMFEKYATGLDVIPAPCDFCCIGGGPICLRDCIPCIESASLNGVYFHEWLGYWGYKLFR